MTNWQQEIKFIRSYLRFMRSHDWHPVQVIDEEGEVYETKSVEEAIKWLDDIEFAKVVLYHGTDGAGRRDGITIIRGNNPEEVIADWSCHNADFDALSEAFIIEGVR